MSYCMKCGAKNDEGNKYCEVCGAALEEDTFEEVTLKGNAPEKTVPEENTPKKITTEERTPWTDTEKAAPAGDERKGLAIVSLIFGIVSLVCCCTGCLSFIAAGVAIVCGIVSLSQKRGGKGMAITGLILGGLGLLLSIVGLFFLASLSSGEIPEWLQNIVDLIEDIFF